MQAILSTNQECGGRVVATDTGFVRVRLPPPSAAVGSLSTYLITANNSVSAVLGNPVETTIYIGLQYGATVTDMSLDRRTRFEVLTNNSLDLVIVVRLADGTPVLRAGSSGDVGLASVRVFFTHVDHSLILQVTVVAATTVAIVARSFPAFRDSELLSVSNLSRLSEGAGGVWQQAQLNCLVTYSNGYQQLLSEVDQANVYWYFHDAAGTQVYLT